MYEFSPITTEKEVFDIYTFFSTKGYERAMTGGLIVQDVYFTITWYPHLKLPQISHGAIFLVLKNKIEESHLVFCMLIMHYDTNSISISIHELLYHCWFP